VEPGGRKKPRRTRATGFKIFDEITIRATRTDVCVHGQVNTIKLYRNR
jgi:hypothetical protein